jgi:anti-sigma regulatory factor (Ser/Thr protein kinase)
MTEQVVTFYDDESNLLASATAFVDRAIERGDVAVMIASDDHRRTVEAALSHRGTDVAKMVSVGRLVSIEADSLLAAFTVGEVVDPVAFRVVVSDLVGEAGGSGLAVDVYDDTVTRLWDAGEIPEALELEGLWAEIVEELSFTRHRAYPSEMADGAAGSAVLRRVDDLYGPQDLMSPPDGNIGFGEIQASAEFGANWSAPGTARRWSRSVLGRWELASDELLDDASLVITELANNAVLHARSAFVVDVHTELDLVRLSVHDDSLSMPTVGVPGAMDRFGRGLGIVAALASSWGVDPDAEGKVVWARLAGASPR